MVVDPPSSRQLSLRAVCRSLSARSSDSVRRPCMKAAFRVSTSFPRVRSVRADSISQSVSMSLPRRLRRPMSDGCIRPGREGSGIFRRQPGTGRGRPKCRMCTQIMQLTALTSAGNKQLSPTFAVYCDVNGNPLDRDCSLNTQPKAPQLAIVVL